MAPDSGHELAKARKASIDAVSALASALRALLEQPEWSPKIRSATDVKRATGLSHRVAWEIHRVATAEVPMAEARHLPKRTALLKLCDEAGRVGIDPALMDQVHDAFKTLEDAARTVAGDRETFAELADAWCGKEHSETSSKYLRQAFRANRHIWGVAAKASFMSYIALPKPARWIHLRGICSLRSSRRNSWDICGNRGHGTEGSPPLELAAKDGTNLIQKYCRGPIPHLDRRTEDEWQITRASFDASGEVAPHTLVFGERLPAVDHPGLRGRLFSSFPTERILVDLLVHRSLGPKLASREFYAGNVAGSRPLGSVPVRFRHQESCAHSTEFKELSSYPALLEEAVALDGYALEDFELFRATCDFPPVGGVLDLRLEFETPDEAP